MRTMQDLTLLFILSCFGLLFTIMFVYIIIRENYWRKRYELMVNNLMITLKEVDKITKRR